MKGVKTYKLFDENDVVSNMVNRYINDILELERENIKLQNKVDRVVSGSKKHHKELQDQLMKEKYEKNKIIDELKRENGELKLGITFRNDIILALKEIDHPKVQEILDKVWNESLEN